MQNKPLFLEEPNVYVCVSLTQHGSYWQSGFHGKYIFLHDWVASSMARSFWIQVFLSQAAFQPWLKKPSRL